MDSVDEPDLLECVKIATQPLTKDGDFLLKTVKLQSEYDTIIVELCSEKIDISLISKLAYRKSFFDPLIITCAFTVKPQNMLFFAEYLNAVLGTHFTSKDEKNFSATENLTKIECPHEKIEYLEEMNQICNKMKKNLSKVFRIFNSDHIDETIRIYTLEFRKNVKEGNIF